MVRVFYYFLACIFITWTKTSLTGGSTPPANYDCQTCKNSRFPPNGVDDALQTGNIDFTSTDKDDGVGGVMNW